MYTDNQPKWRNHWSRKFLQRRKVWSGLGECHCQGQRKKQWSTGPNTQIHYSWLPCNLLPTPDPHPWQWSSSWKVRKINILNQEWWEEQRGSLAPSARPHILCWHLTLQFSSGHSQVCVRSVICSAFHECHSDLGTKEVWKELAKHSK